MVTRKHRRKFKNEQDTKLWGVMYVDRLDLEESGWAVEPILDKASAQREFDQLTSNGTEYVDKKGISYYELMQSPQSP